MEKKTNAANIAFMMACAWVVAQSLCTLLHELSGGHISPSSSCQVVFVLEGTMEAGGMGIVGVWL